MKTCRECGHQVSEQAYMCPNCGAPRPAREKWDGWGYEYKSKTTLFGLPLLHISFKYSSRFIPVPARGVIAIGQFSAGIINISQFGVGVFCLSQFAIGAYAIAQFGIAYSLIAQIGIYLDQGYGQALKSFAQLFGGS